MSPSTKNEGVLDTQNDVMFEAGGTLKKNPSFLVPSGKLT